MPFRAAFRLARRSTWPKRKTPGSRTWTATAIWILPAASAASTSDIAASRWSTPSRPRLDRFLHTCVQVTPYEDYVRLAERMNQVTPGKFPKKTLFVNSGAEAVENAVKIARAHTGRSGIIAFEDAFHGRTMMTLALTSKTHPYKAGFAPFPGDVYRIPYAYCYRCSYSLKYPSCDLFCARHLEDTFKRVVASEDVAAVIAEPVLGRRRIRGSSQGFFPRADGDLPQARRAFYRRRSAERLRPHRQAFCQRILRHRAGYCGDARNRWAGGFRWRPLPAAPKSWTRLAPAGWAAHLPAIRFPARLLWPCWISLSARICWPAPTNWATSFRSARGSGRSAGRLSGTSAAWAECRRSNWCGRRTTREPAPRKPSRSRRYCYEHGLITITAGSYSNVVRVLVPLVVTDQQMDEGMDVLESALQMVYEKKGAVAQPV